MEFGLAIVALLVAAYSLLAARLERLSISSAFAFVVIGILVSEDFLGILALEPEARGVKLVAEITLALVLFGDASTVDLKGLRRDAGPVVRLLVPGLLLTIVSGTFLAFGASSRHHAGTGSAHRLRLGADGCRPRPAGHHGSPRAGSHSADPQRRERTERRDRDPLRVPCTGARHGRGDRL